MTSSERAKLRSAAQGLSPYVMVGHNGITENVVGALNEALDCHELVKVRFQDFKEETKNLSNELAEKAGCTLVAVTGFTAVFYRKASK